MSMQYDLPAKKDALEALKSGKTNVTEMAQRLGVSRKTIYEWLEQNKNQWKNSSNQKIVTEEKHNQLLQELRKLIFVHPEAGCRTFTKILNQKGYKVSFFLVYQLLRELGAHTPELRSAFKARFSGPGRFAPSERIALVESIVKDGETVVQVAQKTGVSEKTLYEWLNKYKTALTHSQNPFEALKDKYIVASNHPKAVYPKIRDQMLDLVISSPQDSSRALAKKIGVSHWTVWHLLEKYNLNHKADRYLYAQKFARLVETPALPQRQAPQIAPILRQLTPNLLPAPPPQVVPRLAPPDLPPKSSSNVFASRSGLIGFSLTFLSVLFLLYHLIAAFASVSSIGEFIGMLFAAFALTLGLFFFMYSMKYYFTIALVLLFSRKMETNEATGKIRSSLASFVPPGSGLIADVSGIGLEYHPFVSIHLPLYNEKRVVNRLLEAITTLDYENYEVIVCDDSTDETKDIVQEWRNHPRVKISHRETREGFKGGALKEAVKMMDPRTEFVLVFDADFMPFPDTIEQFLKYFKAVSPLGNLSNLGNVAVVQGYQWHVLNKSENWITQAVRTEYSGSYVIERSGIEIYEGLKQIAGSVYLIRADVLRHYGWGTSLTEDFELTLKLYQDGYRVIYTPYIQTPSECVSTLKRLVRQRMRWAEGHSFNIRKYFKELLFGRWESQKGDRVQGTAYSAEINNELNPKPSTLNAQNERTWIPSRLSLSEKLEFLYLSPYYLQSFFFILGTFSWFLAEVVFRVRLPFWTAVWGWSLVLTNMLSLPLMNAVGLFLEEAEGKDYAGIPGFLILSYILAPFQAYASVKGFIESEEGPWFRTPKTGRITDTFRRGHFYRWLSGILPGRQGVSASSVSTRLFSLGDLSHLGNLRNKNRLGRRWFGNLVFTSFILFLTSLIALSSVLPAVLPQAQAQETRIITTNTKPPEKERIKGQIVIPTTSAEVIFHTEPRVRFKKGGYEIEMTALELDATSSNPQSKAYRRGVKVVYPQLFGDIDLEYRVGTAGISEQLVLDSFQEIETFTSRLRLTGLEVLQDPVTDTISFYPKKGGEAIFRVETPFMYEKNDPSQRSEAIIYELEKEGDHYLLTKRLTDEGKRWLASPERKFPVLIDPSTSEIQANITSAEAELGSVQRKIAYMPNATGGAAWYAFHADATAVVYEKCLVSSACDAGTDWTLNNVDGGDSGDQTATIWVEGDLIWIAWNDGDNTVDAVEFRSLDVTSDTLGTKCTSADQGDTFNRAHIPYIAVGNNGDVLVGYAPSSGAANLRDIWEVPTGTCTFTSIVSGSGLPAASVDNYVVALGLANKIHIIYEDGADTINHSVFDVTNSTWDSADTLADNGVIVENGNFSAVTDGSSIWLLYFDTTTTTVLQTCASTCTTTWANLTAPWTSGLTSSDSLTLTYFENNILRACLADGATSGAQDIVCKDSPSGTISWGSQFAIGFTSSDYLNVSSVMSVATTLAEQFGLVAEDNTNNILRFASIPENLWVLLVLLPVLKGFGERMKWKKRKRFR